MIYNLWSPKNGMIFCQFPRKVFKIENYYKSKINFFLFSKNNLLIKKSIMTKYQEDCPICRTIKSMLAGEKPKDFIAENEQFAVSVESMFPSAKAHSTLRSKEHKRDIREINKNEWNSLLPLLQDTIHKINKVYHPVGYSLMIPTGELGGQSVPHFYMRVIPKYKKDYGIAWVKRPELVPTLQEYQEAKDKLQASREGIINEKNKVITKLASPEIALQKGHLIISSKEFMVSEIDQVDSETWSQMGELLQECINKTETQLNVKDFQIGIALGKISGIEQQTHQELQIHVTPRYTKPRETGKFVMESKRIARKILDPDNPEYSYRDKTKSQELEELKRQITQLQEENQKLKQELKATSEMTAFVQQRDLPPKI